MYYSYDFEDGIEFHDTAEEAKQRAESALDASRDHACESGWSDEEWQISWGKVSERAVETKRETPPEGSEFEYISDYELKDPSNDLHQSEQGTKR
jgi:hypothetical protein